MSKLKPCFAVGIREAGCDEAGRGCLAGPVMAAAVILPKRWNHPFLNDSKKMTAIQREVVRKSIESEALCWAVGTVSPAEIDAINILQASFLAMHRALDQLQISPECLLIDGNRFRNYKTLPHHCIIKGDGIYRSIAAASILAKTHRDQFMTSLHTKFPEYNWARNKGYPTAEHRAAIERVGPCDHHRKSFALLPPLLLEI